MTLETATREIRNKRRQLRLAGFAIGNPQGSVQDAGSGGFVQVFDDGVRIYWHRATGAHEVHGRILAKYLTLGGPGRNPRTGRRDFGFPKTDEGRTPFGTEVSQFEFGTVYNVPSFEAVGVYGPLGGRVATGGDGLPVSEPFRLAAGQFLLCERCAYFLPDGTERVLRAGLQLPMLGRPALVGPSASQKLPIRLAYGIDRAAWDALLAHEGGLSQQRREKVLSKLTGALADRFLLCGVKNSRLTRALAVEVDEVTERPTSVTVALAVRAKGQEPLLERTLFDICIRLPDNRIHALAPHSLYARRDWTDFGFMHATDLHVTRRVESFRRRLRDAGRGRSAELLVNPNDSARALFNYANALHDRSQIDFVLATGDLVDYIFEDDDDRKGGGNFRYLERLILGEAPSRDPESVENQELHVPLFTLLGNHDYVINPYALFAEIDVAGFENPVIRKYDSFNLNSTDAKALQGGDILRVSSDAGARMADSQARPNEHYTRRINRDRSYLITLGDNRVVMLDTGPNADVIGDLKDAIEEFFGRSNPDERTFVRGTPNSAGTDLSVLISAIRDAPAVGTLIVAMHNPPLNIWSNDYSHYFRETERPQLERRRLEALINGFISRQLAISGGFLSGADGVGQTWKLGNTKHFKRGSIDDLLDFGVATWPDGLQVTLLGLFTDPKVDAVLCGHVHERVEFRLKREGDGFLYFTDFYTENPPNFRESIDWTAAGGGAISTPVSDDRPIAITVHNTARVGEPVTLEREGPVEFRSLRVPPYNDPLASADNKTDWWNRHRPLVVQSPCVGPIDRTRRVDTGERARASFQGIRALRVSRGLITRISFVTIQDIRDLKSPAGFPRRPLVPGPPPIPEPGPIHAG